MLVNPRAVVLDLNRCPFVPVFNYGSPAVAHGPSWLHPGLGLWCTRMAALGYRNAVGNDEDVVAVGLDLAFLDLHDLHLPIGMSSSLTAAPCWTDGRSNHLGPFAA